YAKGDTKQVISTSSTSPNPFTMFGSSSVGYQSIAFGAVSDGVWAPAGLAGPLAGADGNNKLTTAWGVRGAFNHNWDPYWSTSLFGSYSGVSYDNTAKFFICSTFTAARVTSPSA